MQVESGAPLTWDEASCSEIASAVQSGCQTFRKLHKRRDLWLVLRMLMQRSSWRATVFLAVPSKKLCHIKCSNGWNLSSIINSVRNEGTSLFFWNGATFFKAQSELFWPYMCKLSECCRPLQLDQLHRWLWKDAVWEELLWDWWVMSKCSVLPYHRPWAMSGAQNATELVRISWNKHHTYNF